MDSPVVVYLGVRLGAPAGDPGHPSAGPSGPGDQLEHRYLLVLPGRLPAVSGGVEEEGSYDGAGL